ncbi:MAG: DMP19 family protein [Flavobacterium sp.]
MREFNYILISEGAFSTNVPQDILNSNISVVNYLRSSEVGDDELHPDAFASYCVDYYLNTVETEGLASFIYKSKWDLDLIEIIHAGLTAMEAKEHLEYFEKQMRRVKAFSNIKLKKFFDAPLGKEKETTTLLEDNSFKDISEDLRTLNATWLKSHPDLKVVSLEEMQSIITDFIE